MKKVTLWLLGLITILALNAFSTEEASSEAYDVTYFVKKDTANRMIQSYLVSVGYSDTSTVINNRNLEAIIMDAQSIRNYLKDTSIKAVKVMLAHTQQYINSGNFGVPAGYRSGELTVVLAGYNGAGNYVFAPGGMVPDRGVPCPHSCQTIGTASSNLLQ
jgi:hypothetical protein